jgi:hypothetical protein
MLGTVTVPILGGFMPMFTFGIPRLMLGRGIGKLGNGMLGMMVVGVTLGNGTGRLG